MYLTRGDVVATIEIGRMSIQAILPHRSDLTSHIVRDLRVSIGRAGWELLSLIGAENYWRDESSYFCSRIENAHQEPNSSGYFDYSFFQAIHVYRNALDRLFKVSCACEPDCTVTCLPSRQLQTYGEQRRQLNFSHLQLQLLPLPFSD